MLGLFILYLKEGITGSWRFQSLPSHSQSPFPSPGDVLPSHGDMLGPFFCSLSMALPKGMDVLPPSSFLALEVLWFLLPDPRGTCR